MKHAKHLLPVVTALSLALLFAGCSPKELAKDLIIKIVGTQAGDDEEEIPDIVATSGGSFSYPEGFDTSSRISTGIQDGCLYVAFNGITNKSTGYFNPSSGSVTINSHATTESTKILQYKIALWELSADKTATSYVMDSTVFYPTGGEDNTYTYTGLDTSKLYKLVISYDSTAYYITGGAQVTNVAGDSLTEIDDAASSTANG